MRKACSFSLYTHLNKLEKRGSLHLRTTKPSWLTSGNHRERLARTRRSYNLLLPPTIKMATMDSPSAERNKEAIWSVLSTVVRASTTVPISTDGEEKTGNNKEGSSTSKYKVLEIAAGCGVHTLYFTSQLITTYPHLDVSWYPTDPDEPSRHSLQDRIRNASSELVCASINPAVDLMLNSAGMLEEGSKDDEHTGCDGGGAKVPLRDMIGGFNLMTCINMIHISPWEATVGLMKVASTHLTDDGILYCYGPYKVDGTAAESNLNFDASLKARDPSWGVRNVEDVIELAVTNGLYLDRTVEMPANNLSLIFCKTRT